ncbi:MAG: pyruvate synthase [Nitrospirae bacterium]|nr:pyruvate synthase [Nitrospirota bacterium]
MARELLTGNAAAAWGVRLADVDYVPAFPITPQTEIIETLSGWYSDGTMKGKFVTMDSEHSMLTAAGAASATGARVFTATSSQGLLYAFEVLYSVAGWRVPLVMVNVSRALSSPITLEPDHNDILSARDCGFLQIHTETCQEVLDSVIMSYKLAEDRRVLLPVLVNLDGYYLSFTREPVEIPDADKVKDFLPQYKPDHASFHASGPMAQGLAVLGGYIYSYFKYQMHLASLNALSVHEEIAEEFYNLFGRKYGVVEEYKLDDAEYVLIMSNTFATKGKAAVEKFREIGCKVGLLRLRVVRPLPTKKIQDILKNRKGTAVIDQNISIGYGGIFYSEIAALMCNEANKPVILSFICGLGGKDISMKEFQKILDDTINASLTGNIPGTQLLYTDVEWAKMKHLLDVAGKPVI